MASIIFNSGVPASHSQDARRSQRVYADAQVVNEGNADGFAELVLIGDLNGTSGVREVRRGGGGALLKAYSNYISGGGPYRVSAIVFEIVGGQRQTILQRHDNFTANIVVPRYGGGGGFQSQENFDAEQAAAAAERERIERQERERIERQDRERAERERREQEAAQRRWDDIAEEAEEERRAEQERERQQRRIDQIRADVERDARIAAMEAAAAEEESGYWYEVVTEAPVVVEAPVVETVVAEPWQTEESDWVAPTPAPAPAPAPAPFVWDPWLDEG